MPSRDFYPPEFTAQSRAVLNQVRAAVPDAVLIGGWGTWVRTRGPMSHDIDLIVSRGDLAVLDPWVEGLSESYHLGGRKWRAMLRGAQLDLYVPYESVLGQRLGLRVESLAPRRESVDGWNVLEVPAHVCTRFAALLDRPESLPGEKDRYEIAGLLDLGVDSREAASVLRDASSHQPAAVAALTAEAFEYLQDLDLDRKRRRGLREMAKQWQAALAVSAGEGDEVPSPADEGKGIRLRPGDALPRGIASLRPDQKSTCGSWIKSANAPCVLKPKHRGNHRSRA